VVVEFLEKRLGGGENWRCSSSLTVALDGGKWCSLLPRKDRPVTTERKMRFLFQ